MTLNQFSAALDRLGCALDRWPSAERQAAERLLATSAEAMRLLAQAALVETFVCDHDPAKAIGPDALVRLTNSVMARMPARPAPRRAWLRQLMDGIRLGGGTAREWAPRFAISMAAAAMLGLVAGNLLPSPDEQLSTVDLLALSNTYLPLDVR